MSSVSQDRQIVRQPTANLTVRSGAQASTRGHFTEVPPHLVVDGHFIPREPEQIIVIQRVMDSDLKHVLWIFGPFLVTAFVFGLILWAVWS